jgi:GntR family transcriptional regulator, histidine utilization repressor
MANHHRQKTAVTDVRGYREIKHEIFRRIRSNVWGPGTQLPGEVALAAEFGCARATVNRAMQELSGDGIIERRRKGGSRVKMAPSRQVTFEIPLVRAEIESLPAAYGYELFSRTVVKASARLAVRLKLDVDTRLLHMKCLHRADGSPYQFEERWINLAAVPRAVEADFKRISPNEWLVREVPYTNAEVRFSAVRASPMVAKYLATDVGDPVFRSERTTWISEMPVTYVHLYFAPGHEMIARY